MSHEETAEKKPKVFVSYSWTSQEHVDRILAWCEQLVANAIDVEIDRWSLNEGHDKFAYMEKMVSDSSITHVLIFPIHATPRRRMRAPRAWALNPR